MPVCKHHDPRLTRYSCIVFYDYVNRKSVMSNHTTISELTADLVIYRDLQPCDASLPGLAELRASLCLPPGVLPRKRDSAYARVLLELLRRVQVQREAPRLEMLLVIGDTENDRQMAANLRTVSGLPVLAFIGVDQYDAEPVMVWEGDTATANRWALLEDWLEQVARRSTPEGGAQPWAQTALVLDIDKTLLGPRGRGDAPINEARAEGALQVASDLLGTQLDVPAFQQFYATLCRSEYHSLTRDNQDYVVFITLLLARGVLTLDELRQGMADGTLDSFAHLLAAVEARLPAELTALHAEVRAADAAGDPTPFKAFRYAEFAATVARMADGRLTLCREVMDVARTLVARGVLCLAASDKPSEASLPTSEQAATGLLPLHNTPALVQ